MNTATTQTPTPTTDAPQYMDVSRNNSANRFFFVREPYDSRIWEYCPDILTLYSYSGNWGMFDEKKYLCNESYITTDQWDRFIKRLSLLAAPIRSVVEQLNIDTKEPFLFKLQDDNPIYAGNDKCLLVEQQRKPILSIDVRGVRFHDDISSLVNQYPMIPYDPRLSDCIQRFMMEIRSTMNQWLHLN